MINIDADQIGLEFCCRLAPSHLHMLHIHGQIQGDLKKIAIIP